MYQIVFTTSGIVAYSTTNKPFAQQWLEDNNYDEEGECLNLFKMIHIRKGV